MSEVPRMESAASKPSCHPFFGDRKCPPFNEGPFFNDREFAVKEEKRHHQQQSEVGRKGGATWSLWQRDKSVLGTNGAKQRPKVINIIDCCRK